MIFALSSEFVFATAAARSWPAAYASAEVESIGPAPYFAWYAATNWLFPGEVSSANQSPELKTPFTLLAPTLSGKFTGSFGPLERKRMFGLKCCSIIALVRAKPSATCVPPTTMSGLALAILVTMDVNSFVSAG